jgi:hypothetical protein
MSKKMYRQGDFMFVHTDETPPEDAQKEQRVQGKAIVGYGEATGHHHAIVSEKADILTIGYMRWIVADEPVEISHQEHHVITLPAGVWTVVQERTYHAGNISRVVD